MHAAELNLRYYLDELSYLREQGREFARRYPAVGARLELAAGKPADPHVERLIESFAFLTARLQRRIDGEFPEVSAALLGVLYPQLATIVPPIAIAQFEPDLAGRKWSGGYRIESGTPLFARNREGVPCRFRSCYGVTLWPVRVAEAAVDAPARYQWLAREPSVAAVIRLRIECLDPGFAGLAGFDTLQFHLDGDDEQTGLLYDLFAAECAGLAVAGAEGPVRRLPAECLRPAGFDTEHAVLPNPPPAHAGYRLLQEYFHCPRKFLFFDVNLPADALGGKAVDVLVLLRRPAPAGLRVTPARFRLGCTPVINLFPRTSEPVRVDHRSLEYRLVADHRRETTTEIHSVLSVSASANPKQSTRRIEPFYSLRHRPDEDHGPGVAGEPRAFWHTRRAPRRQDGVSGTEVFLSFHDRDFTPSAPPCDTVYAHLLCTNRALAAELPAGALLEMDQAAPAASIRCLDKPSPAGYPALEGATLWRLVSSLSLNHLSLGGERGLAALKEILRLYCPGDRPASHRQIEGIRAIGSRHAVRRGGVDAWRGFRHGTAIEIVFDAEDSLYVGGSAAMLAAVLRHFLALHGSVNSFTEVSARRDGEREDWIRWPPLAGSQPLI